MNKHFKLLTILLSLMLCFSAFSMTVWAIDADGDGYDDETGEYVGGDVTDPPVYTDPVNEPTAEPTYAPTDPPSYEDPTDPPSYEEPTDPPQEPPQSSYYGNDNSYFVDEPSYVGGGQSYVAPISTAPSVPLIDSKHDIDDNELSSKDWNDISANLKNAGSSGDDSDDFSFIQKNTSAGDDGNWVLIIGVVLVLLSISGIVYFIASGILLRRRLAPAVAGASHSNAQSRYRSNDDYDDGYKVSKKEAKQKDRSRRYDTADIKLPKNKGKNRYR